jgi:hypothetical protein
MQVFSDDRQDFSCEHQRFPAFPIPVARLVRLAIDRSRQGQSAGEFLFMDALQRCHKLAKEIGMAAVAVVDEKEAGEVVLVRFLPAAA